MKNLQQNIRILTNRSCFSLYFLAGCILVIDLFIFRSSSVLLLVQEVNYAYQTSQFLKDKGPITNLTIIRSGWTEANPFLNEWNSLKFYRQRNKYFYYTISDARNSGYRMCNQGLCVGELEICPITDLSLSLGGSFEFDRYFDELSIEYSSSS